MLITKLREEFTQARKSQNKDKREFISWVLSTLVQSLSVDKQVNDQDITDDMLNKHINQLYSAHRKTLVSLDSIKYKDRIAQIEQELKWLQPYSTMGLTPEQVEFIKEYNLANPKDVSQFNKAIGKFKTIDRKEANQLYANL